MFIAGHTRRSQPWAEQTEPTVPGCNFVFDGAGGGKQGFAHTEREREFDSAELHPSLELLWKPDGGCGSLVSWVHYTLSPVNLWKNSSIALYSCLFSILPHANHLSFLPPYSVQDTLCLLWTCSTLSFPRYRYWYVEDAHHLLFMCLFI